MTDYTAINTARAAETAAKLEGTPALVTYELEGRYEDWRVTATVISDTGASELLGLYRIESVGLAAVKEIAGIYGVELKRV